MISGRGTDADRAALSAALSRASALRLEAAAATSYLEAIAHAPHSAPADLVEELVAEGAGQARTTAPPARRLSLRWFAPNLRTVAACAVVVLAGGATWSIHRWQQEPAEAVDVDDGVLKKSAPLVPLHPTTAPPAETQAPAPAAVPAAPPASSPAVAPAPPAAAAPADAVAPAAREAAPPPVEAQRSAVPPAALSDGAAMRRRVPTVAVTAKPAAPCPPPPANDAAPGAVPAQGAADAAPPADCAAPPADRFTGGAPGGDSSAAAAAAAPAKPTRVLRPTLTAPPVDGSLGQLVAPTPMTQAPRPVETSPDLQSAPPAAPPR